MVSTEKRIQALYMRPENIRIRAATWALALAACLPVLAMCAVSVIFGFSMLSIHGKFMTPYETAIFTSVLVSGVLASLPMLFVTWWSLSELRSEIGLLLRARKEGREA